MIMMRVVTVGTAMVNQTALPVTDTPPNMQQSTQNQTNADHPTVSPMSFVLG